MCVSQYSRRGGESLLRQSQVSHLTASSCDGNRNRQKSEADTANGFLQTARNNDPKTTPSLFSLSFFLPVKHICSHFTGLFRSFFHFFLCLQSGFLPCCDSTFCISFFHGCYQSPSITVYSPLYLPHPSSFFLIILSLFFFFLISPISVSVRQFSLPSFLDTHFNSLLFLFLSPFFLNSVH